MSCKVYVSLPMTGQMETAKQRALEAGSELNKLMPYCEVVYPFDVINESFEEHPLSFYLGKDIELLMECDAIYMCKGHEYSKGCNLERICAELYGKQILYQE